MSLESPQTYAEWYWRQGLDANRAFDESIEQALSGYLAGVLSDIPEISKLPSGLQSLLGGLAKPPSPGLGSFIAYTGAETASEIIRDAMSPALAMLKRAINRRSLETWLTSDEAITLSQRKKITDEFFYSLTQAEGYDNIIADSLYTSKQPYPSIPELITYARYEGDPDNPKEDVWKLFDVDPNDYALWDWLSLQKINTEQALSLYKRQFWTINECVTELARLGWHIEDRPAVIDLAYTLPNAMLLVQGGLIQRKETKSILEDISKADIHPDYAQVYLDAILTKPATIDLISYELRKDPTLSELDIELRKIGIHPDYYELYKELAYQIPPVADIITMAVREAFTPEIAAKFGQYEGLPPEFVIWVQKKGLSKEWAERYWAAHWSLPSPQQGFEMLHRGVITQEELSLLLRALDIMPFWRDKLIDISYNPLTRVDVRRMYSLGVITETEVNESYKTLGYDDVNAKRMTEFTIKQVRQTLSKFTPADITNAYVKRLIDEGKTRSLLRDIDIKDAEITLIINSAEHKREWAYKQELFDAIENLYKKGKYTEEKTRTELRNLNFTDDYITTQLQQWELKAAAEKIATWTTTQTLTFLKKGLISTERARQEFIALGYDAEHIKIYLASATIAKA